jgi:hypothetical protein
VLVAPQAFYCIAKRVDRVIFLVLKHRQNIASLLVDLVAVQAQVWLLPPPRPPQSALCIDLCQQRQQGGDPNPGSLAKFAAMRRASSLVSSLAPARRLGSFSKYERLPVAQPSSMLGKL